MPFEFNDALRQYLSRDLCSLGSIRLLPSGDNCQRKFFEHHSSSVGDGFIKGQFAAGTKNKVFSSSNCVADQLSIISSLLLLLTREFQGLCQCTKERGI